MANKIFSTYKSGKERSTKNNDRLVVEISTTHVAGIVIGGSSKVIEDFELFEIKSGNFKNFEENFAYAVIASRLLDKPYADKRVFINTDESVIVPGHLYSKENAGDYLNVVYGNNNKLEVFSDDLNNQFQVVNVYRLPVQVREVIEKNLAVVTIEHIYSNILRTLFWTLSALPPCFIKVQLYKSHAIVVVLSEHRLQIIQSFTYKTPDDVLYHLLNICRQFNVKDPVLQVSGMIETDSAVYEHLKKVFRDIHFDEMIIPELDNNDHPAHYFTPFFKLAE